MLIFNDTKHRFVNLLNEINISNLRTLLYLQTNRAQKTITRSMKCVSAYNIHTNIRHTINYSESTLKHDAINSKYTNV